MKKKYTYEEAKNRLEEIVESLEQPSLDIEGLSARIEEAQELLGRVSLPSLPTWQPIEMWSRMPFPICPALPASFAGAGVSVFSATPIP